MLKIELLYDPDIPFLVINLEDAKTVNHRDTYISMLLALSFITAKTWNKPEGPVVGEWTGEKSSI